MSNDVVEELRDTLTSFVTEVNSIIERLGRATGDKAAIGAQRERGAIWESRVLEVLRGAEALEVAERFESAGVALKANDLAGNIYRRLEAKAGVLTGFAEELESNSKYWTSKLGSEGARPSSVNAAGKRREMASSTADPLKVFVVHGRDRAVVNGMFDFLRSLGLQPLEFEQARSLTGHASPYVGDILAVAFESAQAVIVILTGDDEARLREPLRKPSDGAIESELTPQPRPNVLFEAGMALGLFPSRTIIVEVGSLRPISDLQGRHVVRLETGLGSERNAIAERLKTAGCHVTTDGRDWLDRDYFGEGIKPRPT